MGARARVLVDPAGRRRQWKADGSPIPVKPAPLTTIAWRLDHLIFVLAGERNATWIGATPGRHSRPRRRAADRRRSASTQLERAFDLFKRNVGAADPAGAASTPMGEIAGPYAEETPGRVRAARTRRADPPRVGDRGDARRVPGARRRRPDRRGGRAGDRAAVEERLAEDPRCAPPRWWRDMAVAPTVGRRAHAGRPRVRRERVRRHHRPALRRRARRTARSPNCSSSTAPTRRRRTPSSSMDAGRVGRLLQARAGREISSRVGSAG